jgi:elongator complex protein 3
VSKTRDDYTKKQMHSLLESIVKEKKLNELSLSRWQKKFPKKDKKVFTKSEMQLAYKKWADKKVDPKISKLLTKRPIRTLSGVAPITLLTKPWPCPGKCIFCPLEKGMPKSYLSDEPGAQRAVTHKFDPYTQTMARLKALSDMGHSVEKAEIIILGGSWSAYAKDYQIWFIKRIFEALNGFGVGTAYDVVRTNRQAEQIATWNQLIKQQKINETAKVRCVGLVLETRPDLINKKEVIRLRRLGATKIQIGIQSLNDRVLKLNKRGHSVAATAKAIKLLRQAGFKIHAHWMPNLYGSSVLKDKKDFIKLFKDPRFKPDELKIYPCSLLVNTELEKIFKAKKWLPYTEKELLDVVSYAIAKAPAYSRLTRVIRDIPSPNILVGNKKTNFRQIAENYLKEKKIMISEIRNREIRNSDFNKDEIKLSKIIYEVEGGKEVFIEYVVEVGAAYYAARTKKLLGFLRLSLPKEQSFIKELEDSSIIREIHVYGESLGIGIKSDEKAQHLGLGTKLIQEAIKVSKVNRYRKLSVISAIGTREYYRKKGFKDNKLYQSIDI